jgi:hypothetical protein
MNIWQKITHFIGLMYSSDSGVSSKRIFGSIGFICTIIIIWTKKPEYVPELLYTSAALLGLETIFNAVKSFSNNNKDSEGSV